MFRITTRILILAIACIALAIPAQTATALMIGGIEPSSAYQGASIRANVSGTGFVDGASVALVRGDTWIRSGGNVVWDSTTLGCILIIPLTAPPGNYSLHFMNGGINPAIVFEKPDAFVVLERTLAVVQVPGGFGPPTTIGADGIYDDVNGNGRADFADVVLYFNQMTWIAANEPVAAFDFNGNGRIDFADVVWLFGHL